MTKVRPRTKRVVQCAALLGLVSLLGVSRASALVITGSGTSLPGGGTCSWGAGSPGEGAGTVLTCSGIVLTGHSNVYIGVDTGSPNGLSMLGAVAASSSAIFRNSTTGASSITYTSTTTTNSFDANKGTDTTTTTLVLTRTAGTGSVVTTSGNPANSAANGDIGFLFKITAAGGFSIVADANASGQGSGDACSGVYSGDNSTAGAGNCQSRLAIKFYWSDCGDGNTDSPEQCDDGGSNGTAGSCCTTSCTFKTNGTACTDDGLECTNDQCNGASSVCQHPNKTSGTQCTDSSPTNCLDAQCNGSGACVQSFGNETAGTSCSGNGSGDCTAADTCDGSGTCLNNDLAAGTSCPDSSPPSGGNCKDAQCNGTGNCDQNFDNEVDGTGCADGDFCNGSDTCSAGLCSVHAGDPCDGPGDADSDCSETCQDTGFEVGNCNGVDANGSACSDALFCTGNESCTGGVCGSSTGDPCAGPDGDNNCAESCNEVGDNCFANDPNGSACSNGLFCDGTETCTGGSCGNSTGDPCPGPDSDLNCAESCNESADNCLASDPDGTLCRPDAGECDVQETCLGGSCPADGFESNGTACGSNSDTDCDNPDTCDGSGSCQTNGESNGTPCGDPGDTVCDDPDTCNGSGLCVVNNEPNTTSCRPAVDLCDESESCDGLGACPSDFVKGSGVTCRAPSGDCDEEEECDGASTACPADAFKVALTPCGSPTNTDCDNPDTCDGNNNCVANLETSGTACGSNSDTDCDNPDTCDGSGACQINNEGGGTPCGSNGDTDCDNPDTCDGSGSCEVNNEGSGTPCGSNADTDCDNPDTCDGSGACEINNETDGTSCGSNGDTDCDNPDTCSSGSCSANNEPNTVECRPASGGDCDAAENCDGAGNCPADIPAVSGTVCRAASGGELCDEVETCDGSSFTCPADVVKANGTECRASAGDCDAAETCDGSTIFCPVDGFELAGTACGSNANTDCDNPDTCNGSGVCLVNNESNGTGCDDMSSCTTGEACASGVCTGGTNSCIALDHYKCYQGKDLKNPKFTKVLGVDTDDQIVTNEAVDVKKLKFVCTPVDKNGEGINSPNAHLACYQLKAPKFVNRPKVEVSTQFQTSQFELKKGKLLCLPATKMLLP